MTLTSNRTIMELKLVMLKIITSITSPFQSHHHGIEIIQPHNRHSATSCFQSHHHGIEIKMTISPAEKKLLLPIAPSWN